MSEATTRAVGVPAASRAWAPLCLGGSRLRQPLPFETRLERRDQVSRRRSVLDLDALDLLTRDLLFDRLQEALSVLVLVVLWMELGAGQLTDQPFGERPLLVADLRIGAPVYLGRVLDLVGKVEPLEEEAVLVPADRDRRSLAAPGNVPTAIRWVFSSASASTR